MEEKGGCFWGAKERNSAEVRLNCEIELPGSLCSSWKSGHGGRGDILWVWDCSQIGWEDLIVSVNCLTIHSITQQQHHWEESHHQNH